MTVDGISCEIPVDAYTIRLIATIAVATNSTNRQKRALAFLGSNAAAKPKIIVSNCNRGM